MSAVGQRFSSAEAEVAVEAVGANADDALDLAARLGTSTRALRTAQEMLKRHLSDAGEGQAGTVTASLDGVRSGRWEGVGLMVAVRDDTMRVGVALIADPLVLLAVGGQAQALYWTLLPGGPSVTLRADALKLIRGLAAGGDLTFEVGSRILPPLSLDGGAWDYEDEWRLFEDLAVLEEWSGMTLPVPEVVTAEEATRAAQAASWVRTEQVDATLAGTISFTTREAVSEIPDELRLSQTFGVALLGVDVRLGDGTASVKLGHVDREDEDGLTFRAQPDPAEVMFTLAPPAGRRLPARRTQPASVLPPRERGARSRLSSLALVRRTRRPFAEVLASRKSHSRPETALRGGTKALLDDIRGE